MIGFGVGVTTYVSAVPTSHYGVEVLSPDNKLITLFDANMTSPTSRYSLLWKVGIYYQINPVFSLVVEYIYQGDPVARGTYIFYHTRISNAGQIKVYQREFRFGIFYRIDRIHK